MKTAEEKNKPKNAASLESDVSSFDITAQGLISELEKQKAGYEKEARMAANAKKKDLAMKYYQMVKSIDAKIDAIHEQRLHSKTAVTNSKLTELNIAAAKLLQSTAVTQSQAVRAVNPEKVEMLADVVSKTAAQLSHTSKVTNNALSGISERTNAERLERQEDSELEENAEDSEFLEWLINAQTPVSVPVSGSVEKEKDDWKSELRRAAEKEKQTQ